MSSAEESLCLTRHQNVCLLTYCFLTVAAARDSGGSWCKQVLSFLWLHEKAAQLAGDPAVDTVDDVGTHCLFQWLLLCVDLVISDLCLCCVCIPCAWSPASSSFSQPSANRQGSHGADNSAKNEFFATFYQAVVG